MDGAPHMSSAEFRRLGHELVDWIARYFDTLDDRPVASSVRPGDLFHALPASPPEKGEEWSDILRDFERLILPAVTHWQSPNFHGYFPCNNSAPAILGELLSAGLGINGFLWQCSPAITELEMRVMDWLAQALGLPPDFHFECADPTLGIRSRRAIESRDPPDYVRTPGGGVILGTASEAALTALVAARHRAAPPSPPHPLTAYCSSQAHSSVIKAAMIAGLGRENVRLIGVDRTLAMRPDALAEAIRRDRTAGLTPCFVCATVGTTSTGAVDPIRAIGEVVRREAPRAWLHADAAWAGAACVCPEFRSMIEGVDLVDSFNFNPHKWLLTNFDCSAFWIRDREALVRSLSINPEYLRNPASESGRTVEYRDWQIPLGRRFRALKLWFVMRHYGVEGLRTHIREHVRLGEVFENLVRGDERFEMPVPRCLSLVCFRLKGPDDLTRRLLERVHATGKALLTHTIAPVGPAGEDRYLIRMAIGAARTREPHVRAAWNLVRAAADRILP